MEQTSTMDKKNQSRPPNLLCKNNQDPSKFGFDYSSKKNGSQYPKKRENEKYDNGKRSSSNRGGRSGQRYVRPREKMGGQVEETDSLSEFGSVQRSGSKKQNITHLLNWWGPGPDRRSGEHGGGRGYRNRKPYAQHAKYNKEHYLQANCQFVVTAGHDYSSYDADADHLVDWNLVEEVRLHVSESPACPICLHPPVAAKVTRCGHIYCYPCILHYLALTDEKWRKCPICFDVITKVDLKSVVTILHKDFTSGQEIELTLMRRERDSLTPIPVSLFTASNSTKAPATLSSSDFILSYSKLIVASKTEVSQHIVTRELDALRCQLAVEGDQPEACFIEEALSLVSCRESLLSSEPESLSSLSTDASAGGEASLGELTLKKDKKDLPFQEECRGETHLGLGQLPPATDLQFPATDLQLPTTDLQFPATDKELQFPTTDKERKNAAAPTPPEGQQLVEEGLANIQLEDLDIGQLEGSLNPTNQDVKNCPKSTFYFYQESSGAHVYLHALNVHMLLREYGALENCPHTIKAKVLEKESDSMSEVLRPRLRYLRHVPIACPFEVVEIEMKTPVVSLLTVAEYQDQLNHRERKRKKKAKEEHRIEKRVQVEEDRMMGRSSRGAKINMTSFKHFPTFAEELAPSPPAAHPAISEEETLSTSSVGSFTDDYSDANSVSFAQMIRCGQKKISAEQIGEAFPSLGGSGASGHRVAAPVCQDPKGKTNGKGQSSDEEEDEAGEKVPDFSTAFSDAFAKALDQASKLSTATSPTEEKRGKKGKKKKKGIVLLSSGGR